VTTVTSCPWQRKTILWDFYGMFSVLFSDIGVQWVEYRVGTIDDGEANSAISGIAAIGGVGSLGSNTVC
jgi:hypothetical protein